MTRWRFIHIPKTAGSAIRQVYGSGTEPGHEHLPSRYFDDGVKLFCVIREPTDRAISLCAYLHQVFNRDLQPEDFIRWVNEGCPHDLHAGTLTVASWRGPNNLFITSPQVSWIDQRCTLLLYERLDRDVPAFMASEIGLSPRVLPRTNKSRRSKGIREYFDKSTQDRLMDRYWDDYRLWQALAVKATEG